MSCTCSVNLAGILSTVRATRQLDEDALLTQSEPRLKALMNEGVTCIEIKSGYGLSLHDEIKQLRVIRRLQEKNGLVEIVPTLLAAHAVPPEFTGRSDAWVDHVITAVLPTVVYEGLAEAVDVFCERIGFSLEQTRRIFAAATSYSLKVKGHINQRSHSAGAHLIAEFCGLSADHLEYLDEEGIVALKKAGSVAVLLPGAFYFLRESQKPPIAALRVAGVPIAVATDVNPGTSPFVSLRLAMNQACVLFGLTPEEALAGVTCHAARALGRESHQGSLTVGKWANFLVWDIEHPSEISYSLGINLLRMRVFRGNIQYNMEQGYSNEPGR